MPVNYSGFFSYGRRAQAVRPRATVRIFHVFCEKASSMSMQKHAMLISKKATDFIYPGQVPVIVSDCPLYAQQKKCQWKFPDEVGESKMVCFMGFLHIEMASQQCGGKLLAGSSWERMCWLDLAGRGCVGWIWLGEDVLAGSGWERMFSLAKVFTPSVAAALSGGSHVKRTRYSYQLTSLAPMF